MKKLIFILLVFIGFSLQSCVVTARPMGEGRGEHHDEGRHGGDDHHGDRH